MKKVILNQSITDLDGNVISMPTGRMLPSNSPEQPMRQEVLPITFASLTKRGVLQSRAKDEAEVEFLFNLAEKLNETSKVSTPEVLELEDTEFELVKKTVISQQVVVAHAFLVMVEEQNQVL